MNVAQVVDLVIISASGMPTLYSANRNSVPSSSSLQVVSYMVKFQNGQVSSATLATNIAVALGDYVLLEYLEEVRQYVIVGKLPSSVMVNIISDMNTSDSAPSTSLSGSVVLASSPKKSELIVSPNTVSLLGPSIRFSSPQINLGNQKTLFNILANSATFDTTKFIVNSNKIDLIADELIFDCNTISTHSPFGSITINSLGVSVANLAVSTQEETYHSLRTNVNIDSLVEYITQKISLLSEEIKLIKDTWCSIETNYGLVVRSSDDEVLTRPTEDLVKDLATDSSAVLINRDTLDKINELVDAVNDLRERVYNLEMLIKTVFPQPSSTTLMSPVGPVTMTATPPVSVSPGDKTSLESLDVDNCLSAWMFSESKKNKKSSE